MIITSPKNLRSTTGLLDRELAWRQHDGGHEDRSNMKYFIAWADKLMNYPPPAKN
jgi:hypothetical protein